MHARAFSASFEPLTPPLRAGCGTALLELRDLASGVAEGPPDASGQDCNTLHTYEALRCF